MYKNYIQHRCRPILSEKLPKIGGAGTTLSENMVVDALNPVIPSTPSPGTEAGRRSEKGHTMPDQHPIHSEGPPQEDDTSGASPKPMLSTEGQIAHLKVRGVAFELCDEQEALDTCARTRTITNSPPTACCSPKRSAGPMTGSCAIRFSGVPRTAKIVM